MTPRRHGYETWPSRSIYHRWRGAMRGTGYECEITYTEWHAIWTASGKWDQRGRHNHSACMLRRDLDKGYQADNVFIGLRSQIRRRPNGCRGAR